MKHPIKAVLFDLGGTLIYFDGNWVEGGCPGVTPEMMAPALKQLYAVSQAHWKVEEDTLPTLDALQRAGYRMAVVSNASDDADVQRLVDNAGIRGYLDLVLSSAACGTRKPNPRT